MSRPATSLLIVDDDLELARMLGEFLAGEGFISHHAPNGMRALEMLAERSFDLVVLDVMMPQLDGFGALKRLRAGNGTPVLMLTARGEDNDRILGLELGADDYLSKPFNPRELTARLRAILRRIDRNAATPRPAVQFENLSLDPADLSVTINQRTVRLTTAEFLVLETLARAPGVMQLRAVLTEQALGRALEPFDRSIDNHVSSLRRKLGLAAGSGVEIRSIRGLGYVLAAGGAP